MKRLLSLLLICTILLSGCALTSKDSSEVSIQETTTTTIQVESTTLAEKTISISGLNNSQTINELSNAVYSELIEQLPEDKYYVENIQLTYLSQEYIDELTANTQENIYFGYTLSELNEQFADTRYIFTVEDGKTVVQEFEKFDDTYEKIIQNVAIGAGVILVCATVSVITGGLGAPAVSLVFAAAATEGTKFALVSAGIGAVIAGGTTYIETGDWDETLKSAALGASEDFKWGAIGGAVTGGASEAFGLFKSTANGLTMNQAAQLQKETKWSTKVLKSLHSPEEAKIYTNAGLKPITLPDGQIVLSQDINWSLVDSNGLSNIERVGKKLAPIDEFGESYEFHHIGMKADAPVALLKKSQHHKAGDYSILHYAEEGKDITEAEWKIQREGIWNNILKYQYGQ